jgi:lysyl-tRNA synthetase class 1
MAESQYWADQVAKKVLKIHPRKKIYVVAAGVTPSGRKHIGNYREIITNAFVAKALEDLGKNVKFIYSWDSFDRFRKVPPDLPATKKKILEKHLGMPDSDVPDPFGCHKSYAKHYEEFLEKESAATGVRPKFIYQDKEFRKCTYAKEIRTLMRNRKKVADILNRSRKEPLPKTWYPLFVYCEDCNKDNTKIHNNLQMFRW